MARYRAEGEAAFEPRSRARKTTPTATPPATVELIAAAAEAARRGRPGRRRRHDRVAPEPPPRPAAVPGHGPPDPDPRRRRHPRAAEATQELLHPLPGRPAERDLAVRLHPLPAHRPDGSPARRRDHHLARRPLPLRPARHRSSPHHRPDRAGHVPQAADQHGYPASTLTDNGMVYTVRLRRRPRRTQPPRAELRRLEHRPEELPTEPPHHLRQGRTLPADPEEMAARPTRPADHHRRAAGPDRHVRRRVQPPTGRTGPCPTGPPRPPPTRPAPKPPPRRPRTDTHDRVRHDTRRQGRHRHPALAGRLHHIGIGRTHAGTHVLLLVQDLHIRVVDAATGELLRELTIDPSRDYQPTGATRPTRNDERRTCNRGFGCPRCLETSQRRGLAVSWLRTSRTGCLKTCRTDVAGHRDSRWLARLGHVEGPSGHHRCAWSRTTRAEVAAQLRRLPVLGL